MGKWLDETREKCEGEIVMVLVGNKVDMAKKYFLWVLNEEVCMKIYRRVVSYEEGEEVAEKNGMIFFEISNKTGHNVKEVSE